MRRITTGSQSMIPAANSTFSAASQAQQEARQGEAPAQHRPGVAALFAEKPAGAAHTIDDEGWQRGDHPEAAIAQKT